MAAGKEISTIYVSAKSQEGCCPGGLTYMGFSPVPDQIKYFVSTGRKDIMGEAAEYLKSSSYIVERCFKALVK
jgi:hypothetical protein